MGAEITQDNIVFPAVTGPSQRSYVFRNAKRQTGEQHDVVSLVAPTGLVDVYLDHGAYICAQSRADTGAYKIVAYNMPQGIAFNISFGGEDRPMHFRDGRLFCPESNRMVSFLKDGKPVAPWWGQRLTRKATTFDSSKGPQEPKFGSNQPGWWNRKPAAGNGLGGA